jgi:transketolase
MAVICKTVKGRGVSYMENVPIWHYRAPNKDEYRIAPAELAEVAS